MIPPFLNFEPPANWVDEPSLVPPDASEAPRTSLALFRAYRPADPTEKSRAVASCFETQLNSWAPEVEPSALSLLASIATSTALRIAPVERLQVSNSDHLANVTYQSIDGKDAVGRIWLGFTQSPDGMHLSSCFVLCVAGTSCVDTVRAARDLRIFVPAPAPNVALRALLTVARKPNILGSSVVVLVLLGGFLAVVTRKRPRFR